MSKRTTAPAAALARIAAAVVVGAGLLAGCSDEQQEIRAWMQQQRAGMPTIKETIPPPKPFEPFRYENTGQVDPFAQSRLVAKGGAAPGAGIQPDLTRRREVLEGFPLDAIRMVGHMSNGRSNFALLQVDSTVFQARVGNYAGQNYGMITRVTESEVRLKELVQDAAGDWTERETALQLQEAKVQERKK